MSLRNKTPKHMRKPKATKEPRKMAIEINLTQKKLKYWDTMAKYILDAQNINKGLPFMKKVENPAIKIVNYLFTNIY